jgi:integrase
MSNESGLFRRIVLEFERVKSFTERGLMGLKCAAGKDREYFPDRGIGSVQGLNLMITSKDAKSWVWRSRHPATGKQVKKTFGTFPAFGLADAREWADAQNLARAKGYDLDERRAEEVAASRAETTAAEAAEARTLQWYWDGHYVPTFIPDKYGNETARLVEKHVLPTLGQTPISQITHDDLDEIIHEFAESAPGSAERLKNNLQTLFRRAKKDHRRDTKLTSNPAEDLVLPRREVAIKDRSLSDAEIVYFYRALSRTTGWVRVHAECLALILDVGGRMSEGRKLRFDEIDFTTGVWELPKSRSKNRKAHIMRLPAETIERLKACRAREGQVWVFESAKFRGQAYNSVSKAHLQLRDLMEAIGREDGTTIPSWSAHDLRRTFKSHLYEAAANSRHPLVTEANIDRAQNHRTGSDMGRRYDKNQYVNEKAAVYRYWQDHLIRLRAKALDAERKVARHQGHASLAA